MFQTYRILKVYVHKNIKCFDVTKFSKMREFFREDLPHENTVTEKLAYIYQSYINFFS